MLAKLRVLLITVLALVAVPETIFADDSAKVTALEALLKRYMDENAELKKVIADQGANEPEAAADVVVDESNAIAPAESADETVRLELYSSEIICQRAHLNSNEYGLVVKMNAQKYADEAKRRGLNCGVGTTATSTKASYTCEDDPAYCNNSQLCEAAITRIGGSVSWSSDPNKRFFVSEAKNRNISCGLTYPLASCAGWNGTVAKIEGVDTENAVMSGYVMEKDFREYCTRDPGGETTTFGGELSIDQCVSKYFSVNKEQVVTFANCNTGELVNEWFLAGVKKTSKETFPLSAGTNRSCASGLLPLEAQFSMLCPSNANSDDWIAAGQQRKADAENLTSDADARAAEEKRIADEEKKKEAEKKNPSNSDYYTCTKDHETLATLAEKYFSRQDIDRSFWKQCTVHVGLTILEFTDDYAVAYKSSSMFTGFTYGTTNSIYSGGPVVCMDADLGTKKRGFGWDCTAS